MSRETARRALPNYKTVDERLVAFIADHALGSVQAAHDPALSAAMSELYGKPCFAMRAEAYRDPDDERPGVGHAFEWIDNGANKTSILENCETSAWGRALAALGYVSERGVATDEEIRTAEGKRAGLDAEAAATREAPAVPASPDEVRTAILGAKAPQEIESIWTDLLGGKKDRAQAVEIADERGEITNAYDLLGRAMAAIKAGTTLVAQVAHEDARAETADGYDGAPPDDDEPTPAPAPVDDTPPPADTPERDRVLTPQEVAERLGGEVVSVREHTTEEEHDITLARRAAEADRDPSDVGVTEHGHADRTTARKAGAAAARKALADAKSKPAEGQETLT